MAMRISNHPETVGLFRCRLGGTNRAKSFRHQDLLACLGCSVVSLDRASAADKSDSDRSGGADEGRATTIYLFKPPSSGCRDFFDDAFKDLLHGLPLFNRIRRSFERDQAMHQHRKG